MESTVIYGPPGCGKTTKMLDIFGLRLKSYDISEIIFISFTKAGAREAQTRLKLNNLSSDNICTLHSLMYRLGGYTSAQIVDSKKLQSFGIKVGFKFRGTSTDTNEQMELGDMYVSLYMKAINTQRDFKSIYFDSDRPGTWGDFQFFCFSYQDWKINLGLIDFNDMLSNYLENPVNHGAKIIMGDEGQDFSNLQWAVIKQMATYDQVTEIIIAGDDDQAIFEWSGANPHGMFEFEQQYKSNRITLEQSWRIPSKVHDMAIDIISNVQNRVHKNYLPRSEAGAVRRFSNFDVQTVAGKSDVLILCRNFVTKREIEQELIRNLVPYTNIGGFPSLFDTKLARAIRLFHRLKTGEVISKKEHELLISVCDNRTKEELLTGNVKGIINRGYLNCFNIKSWEYEFYKNADFNSPICVRLSTIHSAKGGEADHVVIHTGLTEKTIKDLDTNMDAELRVWYVAITRAKHSLDVIDGEGGIL